MPGQIDGEEEGVAHAWKDSEGTLGHAKPHQRVQDCKGEEKSPGPCTKAELSMLELTEPDPTVTSGPRGVSVARSSLALWYLSRVWWVLA